jgi:hypothetical protein
VELRILEQLLAKIVMKDKVITLKLSYSVWRLYLNKTIVQTRVLVQLLTKLTVYRRVFKQLLTKIVIRGKEIKQKLTYSVGRLCLAKVTVLLMSPHIFVVMRRFSQGYIII